MRKGNYIKIHDDQAGSEAGDLYGRIAKIHSVKKNKVVVVVDYGYYDVVKSDYNCQRVSADEYFLQCAEDYFGNSIRDNSREEKILIGRRVA